AGVRPASVISRPVSIRAGRGPDITGRCRQLWTPHHQLLAGSVEVVRTDGCAGIGSQVLKHHLVDFLMAGGGDVSRIDTVVDHVLILNGNVVDNRGVIENLGDLRWRNPMVLRVIVTEMAERHEGIYAEAQSKFEINSHRMIVEPESQAGHKHRLGWQRRPTAIVRRVPPAYPGRAPAGIRPPYPPRAGIAEPPAIMEGRPAPGIIRLPVPAAVGVDPPPAIAVRLPARVDGTDRGPPATSVTANFNPRPVGRE